MKEALVEYKEFNKETCGGKEKIKEVKKSKSQKTRATEWDSLSSSCRLSYGLEYFDEVLVVSNLPLEQYLVNIIIE